MTHPLDDLGRSVRESLGDGPDDFRRERQRRRLLRSVEGAIPAARRRQRTRLVWAGGALAAAGVVALSIVLLLPDTELIHCWVRGGNRLEEGQRLEARAAPVNVDFSEGSELIVERRSRVRLRRARRDKVQVVLESGSLRADIASGHHVSWTYQAGPYQVHVLGTLLGISWNTRAGVLKVGVTRGSVRVTGGAISSGGITVGAGQRVKADFNRGEVRLYRDPERRGPTPSPGPAPSPEADATSAVRATDATAAVDSERLDAAAPTRVKKVRPGRPAHWKKLARAGEYAAAVSAARGIGWDQLLRRSGPWDLLLLADAARLGGEPPLARRTLVLIRKRFTGQKAAKMAAFRLGRLAFDQQRDYKLAATWFRRFLKEAPKSTLAAGARGRLMLSLQRAGDQAGAARMAREYLSRHPGGSYAAAATSVLAGARPK